MTSRVEIPDRMFQLRDDFIPQERYVSREFAELEKRKLWHRVWQVACREEDIPASGDYCVYDITDQSIIVVRDGDNAIRAFHNVCPHRGRKLLEGRGRINKFHCGFHAWQWNLNGDNIRILDAEDWQGCPAMNAEDMSLAAVRTATWGGFVFVSLDPDGEAFEDFIAPVPQYLDCLQLEKMTYAWALTVDLEANWKVAQEAFMESYHVWGTHPQFIVNIDEKNASAGMGRHGKHFYFYERPVGAPSRRLNKPVPDDVVTGFSAFLDSFHEQVGDENGNGQMTARSIRAAQEALATLPRDTPFPDYIDVAIAAMKKKADEVGAPFPMMSPQEKADMGVDWNVFPNLGLVMSFDGCLIFRARPRGDDPNKCYLDMWSVLCWADGECPGVRRAHLDNWRDSQQRKLIPSLLVQDTTNIEFVQQGMHSLGLKGLRPNPVQERQISNFHKVINDYLLA